MGITEVSWAEFFGAFMFFASDCAVAVALSAILSIEHFAGLDGTWGWGDGVMGALGGIKVFAVSGEDGKDEEEEGNKEGWGEFYEKSDHGG